MNTNKVNEIREYLINKNCELIAVTKTHPIETLFEAYNIGLRKFGENKAQEMARKYQELPKDIEWHMIGHMQSNKVKYIAPFVSLIHSVDSFSILDEINKQALKFDRVINCLIQIHIAEEETKFGLNKEEAEDLITRIKSEKLENVQICGLMGMASNTSDQNQVREEFKKLRLLFDQFKSQDQNFSILSMGMSSDYKIGVEEGSTLVRIGSLLFGDRYYPIA
ncbi:MAG: YggS family pyridoxal phosphate-dependent enzyme [Opitutaceae bacterium]|nr:YggS family pyridoxal phosphate-dependent enzyme [Cytophagales bacterium]